MQIREKAGILVLIFLIILLAVSVGNGRASKAKTGISCQTVCRQMGNGNWLFPLAKHGLPKTFSTKEDCVYACQNRSQQ